MNVLEKIAKLTLILKFLLVKESVVGENKFCSFFIEHGDILDLSEKKYSLLKRL